MPSSSPSSRRSASSSVSPPSTPPPGSSQYSLPGFSWRQSSTRSCQRRSAETRMRGSISALDDPKPRTPRSDSGSSSTSTSSTSGSGRITSCAIRIPGSTTNGLTRVGVQEVDQQLAAIARVDQAGRVDDRDAVLRGEARARLDEAGVARRGSRPRARSARAPARPARARRARRTRGRGPRRPRTRAPG